MEQKGIIGFFKRIFGQDKQLEVPPVELAATEAEKAQTSPAELAAKEAGKRELMTKLRNWTPLIIDDDISWAENREEEYQRGLIERHSPYAALIEEAWENKNIPLMDTVVRMEAAWAADLSHEIHYGGLTIDRMLENMKQVPPITMNSMATTSLFSYEAETLLQSEYGASRNMIEALSRLRFYEADSLISLNQAVESYYEKEGDKLAVANMVDTLFKNFLARPNTADFNLSQEDIKSFAAYSELAIEEALIIKNEGLTLDEREKQHRNLNHRRFLLQPEKNNLLIPEAVQLLREKFLVSEELITVLDRNRGSETARAHNFNTAVNLYNKYGFDCDEVYWYPLDGALNDLIDSIAFHEKEKFTAIGFDDDKIAAFRERITQIIDQEKAAPLLSISEKGWNMLGEMTSHADDLKDFLGEPHSLEAGKLLTETGSKLTECLDNEDYSGAQKCGLQLLNEYDCKLSSWLEKEEFTMNEEYGPNNWYDNKFQHKEWILKDMREELPGIKERIESLEATERIQASQSTAPEPIQHRKAPMLTEQQNVQASMKIREAPILSQDAGVKGQADTHKRSAALLVR